MKRIFVILSVIYILVGSAVINATCPAEPIPYEHKQEKEQEKALPKLDMPEEDLYGPEADFDFEETAPSDLTDDLDLSPESTADFDFMSPDQDIEEVTEAEI